MKNRSLFLFLGLASLLIGCSGGGNDNPPDPPKPIEETTSFTPKEGEIRQLFSFATGEDDFFYNYCPSIFVENYYKHTYFCSNKISKNVTDYVAYRKANIIDNKISYTDAQYVLEPGTLGAWDSRHTCDPSIIKGEFKYNNENYSYLMAYLGCLTSDCTLNETGIAVSKSPEGPWIKCDGKKDDGISNINPIVSCSDPMFSFNAQSWGTGQPSLVSVDNKGRVLLFTTIGSSIGTYTNLREYDFSNINDYKLVRERQKIITTGVRSRSGYNDYIINNADFAYDSDNRKIIMIKERQPLCIDNKNPNFIGDILDIYYIDDTEGSNVGDVLFAGNNTSKQWKLIGTFDSSNSGFLRNHNAGLITDEYGHVLETDRIGFSFTRSDEGNSATNQWASLRTYRLYESAMNFPNSYYNK